MHSYGISPIPNIVIEFFPVSLYTGYKVDHYKKFRGASAHNKHLEYKIEIPAIICFQYNFVVLVKESNKQTEMTSITICP